MNDQITIEERVGFGFAAIMARKGKGPSEIGAALGCAPPAGPGWTGNETLRLLGTGPGTWFACTEAASPFWAESLRERLGALASVSDQSGGCTIMRLSGPGARTVLQRGAAIDFHPAAFGPGSAATTVIAHIGVSIWQLDEKPTYDAAIFRSLSGSFRHWLESAIRAL